MKRLSLSTPEERKTRTANKNDKATDKSILFRFNLFISNPVVLVTIYLLVLIIGFLLINYAANTLFSFFGSFKYLLKGTLNIASVFNIQCG